MCDVSSSRAWESEEIMSASILITLFTRREELIVHADDWRATQLTEQTDKTALPRLATIFHEITSNEDVLFVVLGTLMFPKPHLVSHIILKGFFPSVNTVPNFNSLRGHKKVKKYTPLFPSYFFVADELID